MDPRVFSAFPPPAWEPASCQWCGAWVGMLLDAVSEWRQGAGGRRDVPFLAPSPYLTHWAWQGAGWMLALEAFQSQEEQRPFSYK